MGSSGKRSPWAFSAGVGADTETGAGVACTGTGAGLYRFCSSYFTFISLYSLTGAASFFFSSVASSFFTFPPPSYLLAPSLASALFLKASIVSLSPSLILAISEPMLCVRLPIF